MPKHKKYLPHQEWLLKANGDLRLAKLVMNNEDQAVDDAAMFHTQQCAEKALKAYLVFKNEPIEKTHDLEKLLSLCQKFDWRFKTILDHAIFLMPYCFKFRYPDDLLFPMPGDLKKAVTAAEKILRFVKKKIKEPKDLHEPMFK